MAKEQYMLWRIAHYFVAVEHYRIIKVGTSHDEIWLERQENKEFPIIRLFAKNFDWSNVMQKDIDFVAFNAEKIRKQLGFKQLTIQNIYISSLVPVDDFDFRLDKEYKLNPKFKGNVISTLLETNDLESVFVKLQTVFKKNIQISIPDEIDEQHVEGIKAIVLTEAAKTIQTVKNRFERVSKPYITYALMAVCVAMFILMEVSGSSEDSQTLIQFGAKFNLAIESGEWWRLITPMFLHIGVLHLIMNMVSLYYIGTMVEKLYGHWRYFIIFICSGITGSLLSFIATPSIAAGASGAIFGLFGALVFFGVIYPKIFMKTIGMNILSLLAINLAFGFLLPGVDNAGHIGGLIGGFCISAMVNLPEKFQWRYFTGGLVAIVLSLVSIFANGMHIQSDYDKERSLMGISGDYIKNESFEEINQMFEAYAPVNSNNVQYLVIDAYIDIQVEEYGDAIQKLEKSLEIEKTGNAYYYLAFLYADMREWDKAYSAANEALRLEPTNANIQGIIENLDSVRIYYEQFDEMLKEGLDGINI